MTDGDKEQWETILKTAMDRDDSTQVKCNKGLIVEYLIKKKKRWFVKAGYMKELKDMGLA